MKDDLVVTRRMDRWEVEWIGTYSGQRLTAHFDSEHAAQTFVRQTRAHRQTSARRRQGAVDPPPNHATGR